MVNGLPCGICFSHEIFISHGMHGMHGIFIAARWFLDMMTGEHDFLLTNYYKFFLSPTDCTDNTDYFFSIRSLTSSNALDR